MSVQQEIRFEAASHSIDAVERAVYALSDRLSCDLHFDGNDLVCVLHLTADVADQAEEVIHEFRNEVLDQTLRERIRAETHDVRNVIFALAFSNTGLVESSDPA